MGASVVAAQPSLDRRGHLTPLRPAAQVTDSRGFRPRDTPTSASMSLSLSVSARRPQKRSS